MSKLIDLIDNTKTDKNTSHSYIQAYEELFYIKKNDINNILEIGIGEPKENKDNGGSIKLWHDYFLNSNVYGLDIHHISNINENIVNKDRIKLFTSVNAYSNSFIEENLKDIKFDILIDDGPHTLDSMIFFLKNYLPLLNKEGILVIEDIPDIKWINILYDNTPADLKQNIHIYDLRHIKNRWDDILFVIKK
jgi:hypothetical protein